MPMSGFKIAAPNKISSTRFSSTAIVFEAMRELNPSQTNKVVEPPRTHSSYINFLSSSFHYNAHTISLRT